LAVHRVQAVERHRLIGRRGAGGCRRCAAGFVGREQLVQVEAVEARVGLDGRHRATQRGLAAALEAVGVERAVERPGRCLGVGVGLAAHHELQRRQPGVGERGLEVELLQHDGAAPGIEHQIGLQVALDLALLHLALKRERDARQPQRIELAARRSGSKVAV